MPEDKPDDGSFEVACLGSTDDQQQPTQHRGLWHKTTVLGANGGCVWRRRMKKLIVNITHFRKKCVCELFCKEWEILLGNPPDGRLCCIAWVRLGFATTMLHSCYIIAS